jgi:enediyne biosynthesis protein E4
MQAYDVDGDSFLNLVAVGNSYAPDAQTGRYDAGIGWVLKGNGKRRCCAFAVTVT